MKKNITSLFALIVIAALLSSCISVSTASRFNNNNSQENSNIALSENGSSDAKEV